MMALPRPPEPAPDWSATDFFDRRSRCNILDLPRSKTFIFHIKKTKFSAETFAFYEVV